MKRRGNNEGSITERSDGRWEVRISIVTATGKRNRITRYAKTHADARRLLTALKKDQDIGIPIISGKETVSQWLDAWLDLYIAPPRRKPRTWTSYWDLITRYIKPAIGRYALATLSAENIQHLLNAVQANGTIRTAGLIRAVLRSSLNRAVKSGRLARNPILGVDAPQGESEESPIFTIEQTERFLKACAGHRFEGLFWLALGLGLRKGELIGLKLEDLDLEAGTLSVRRTSQFIKVPGAEKRTLVEGEPKRGSKRTLPLPGCIARALVRHLVCRENQQQWAGSDWQENGYVFCTSLGTILDERNVSTIFHRLCARAAVPKIRFHDLRHSCGTFLHSQGASPFTIQAILGHSQISTTRRYTRVEQSIRLAALSKVGDLLEAAERENPEPSGVKIGVKSLPDRLN